MTQSDQPLQDITVLDCSPLFAGPLAAMLFADFGAEVVKVEHPSGGALRQFGGEGLSWKWINRNKRSVPIDLHDERGQEMFKELVADTDVLFEGFRPSTLEGWGLGWDKLRGVNPELVMVRTTGFGQTGEFRDRPGFGTLAEAMSGFAYTTGQPDGPPTLPPIGLADSVAALYSVGAALMALYWRDLRGGHGQYIDTSLVETMFSLMGKHAVNYSVNGTVAQRTGNRSMSSAPRNTYRTKDDRWLAISASTDNIAKRVLRVVGGEELASDPRFETLNDRLEHVDKLDALIQDWMADRTRQEVLEVFEEYEAAIAPVYNIKDIFETEYFWDRDNLITVPDQDLGEIDMPGVFPKLSETPGTVEHTGPELGSDTVEILLEHTSISKAQIEELAAAGITVIEERGENDG